MPPAPGFGGSRAAGRLRGVGRFGHAAPAWAGLLLLLLLLFGGCTRAGARTPVIVFAAASLTESFRALERGFEAEHPEIDVELSFAGSQLLAAQLIEGAPAQVFAAADTVQVDRVAAERALTGKRAFAGNRLVLAVPAGSAITDLADLTTPGTRVVLAGESVPAGRYARQALDAIPVDSMDLRGAVEANVVSNETDVRAVVAKVRLGEADAGIVYATDVAGDPAVEARELPLLAQITATYELAVVVDAQHPERQAAAAAFADYVTSPAGQAILAEHGFGPPPQP